MPAGQRICDIFGTPRTQVPPPLYPIRRRVTSGNAGAYFATDSCAPPMQIRTLSAAPAPIRYGMGPWRWRAMKTRRKTYRKVLGISSWKNSFWALASSYTCGSQTLVALIEIDRLHKYMTYRVQLAVYTLSHLIDFSSKTCTLSKTIQFFLELHNSLYLPISRTRSVTASQDSCHVKSSTTLSSIKSPED